MPRVAPGVACISLIIRRVVVFAARLQIHVRPLSGYPNIGEREIQSVTACALKVTVIPNTRFVRLFLTTLKSAVY